MLPTVHCSTSAFAALRKGVTCSRSYRGHPSPSTCRSADRWLATRSSLRQFQSEGWSGRRGSNPRPTAWKAVTLPLSYSRPRCPARPAKPAAAGFYNRPRSRRAPPRARFGLPSPSSLRARLRAARFGVAAFALCSRSERRLVGRGGFEPPKPLGRQIYSLLHLTTLQPPPDLSRLAARSRQPNFCMMDCDAFGVLSAVPAGPPVRLELAEGFEPTTR